MKRERYTHTFSPPEVAPLRPEDVYAEAAEAGNAERCEEAAQKYAFFTETFPLHATLADRARFWMGFNLFRTEKYWDAVNSFYEYVISAPEDHEYMAMALKEGCAAVAYYFNGASHAYLGNCGYAVRSHEVVVYGEIPAEQKWIDSANTAFMAALRSGEDVKERRASTDAGIPPPSSGSRRHD